MQFDEIRQYRTRVGNKKKKPASTTRPRNEYIRFEEEDGEGRAEDKEGVFAIKRGNKSADFTWCPGPDELKTAAETTACR